ncbi:MAG TPA: ABC transporter ATP-binding protein [Acidimicrobiales bacterium]|nr:ABC transporter ATP-binding protein [Acidimicrobiales bacterium]
MQVMSHGEVSPERVTALREESRKVQKKLSSLPRLMAWAAGILWRSSPRLVVALVASRMLTALQAGVLILVGREALGSVVGAGGAGLGSPSVIAAAVFFAVSAILTVIGVELQMQLSARVQKTTFDLLVDAASRVELEAYESPGFYDRLERCETNALVRPSMVGQALIGLPANLIGVLGLVGALLVVEPLLLPVLVLSFIPFFLLAKLVGRKEFQFATDRVLGDRLRRYLRTVLVGRDEAKEVRAFGSGDVIRNRWSTLYDDYIKLYVRQSRRRVFFGLLSTFVTIAVVGGWIGLIVALYASGRTSGVDLVAGAAGAGLLMGRIAGLASSMQQIYESSLFLEDFRSFINLRETYEAPAVVNPAPPPEHGFDELSLDHVTFRYPGADAEAVHDVSLSIRRGEVVALVGENGSGKTTLAKLLALLYRPIEGRILWDGVDVGEVDRGAWRQKIAVIFQDFVKYQLTGTDNVGLGDAGRLNDTDAIAASARHAGADSFIEPLPEGYETYLSKAFPGGVDLSIGQWQRVALARAFFRDAPFLILDEPTAALDARAEHSLFESIRHLRQGRTVLLISHRFSSVRSADRIFVMKEGKLVEHGDHAALMNQDGLYAELYNLQAAATLAGREIEEPAEHPDREGSTVGK